MSIENSQTIDFIGIDSASGDVILTISDHLPWSEEERKHAFILQEKLNAYLAFVESGEIYQTYPNAEGRMIRIEVAHKYALTEWAQTFAEKAEAIIREAGIALRFLHISGDGQ